MNALRAVAGFLQRWLLPARPAGLYDRQLVVLALALMAVGLVIVASASIPEGIAINNDPFMFVKRHGLFLLMALGISWFVLQVPMARWQHYNGPMLLLAIVMLVLVLLVGRSVNGSVRWLPLGPFNLQPAEFGKLALFVYLAGYLVRRQSEVRERFIGFMKPMAVLFVVAILLLAQPDLGSVVVMFVTSLGMLFLAGARLVQFIGLILVGVSAVVTLIIAEPYRMRRVTSFLDPWADPFGSGYQLTQSLMAFGRGSWFGEGLATPSRRWSTCRRHTPTSCLPSWVKSWAMWACWGRCFSSLRWQSRRSSWGTKRWWPSDCMKAIWPSASASGSASRPSSTWGQPAV